MSSTFPESDERRVQASLEQQAIVWAVWNWDQAALEKAVASFKGNPAELGEILHLVMMAYINIRNNNGPPFLGKPRKEACRMLQTLCRQLETRTTKARVIDAITKPDSLGVSVLTLAKEAGKHMQQRINAVLQCGANARLPDDSFVEEWVRDLRY